MNSCDQGDTISMTFASTKEQNVELSCDTLRGSFQTTNISLLTSPFSHHPHFASSLSSKKKLCAVHDPYETNQRT